MKSRVSDQMREEWKKAVLSRAAKGDGIEAFRLCQPGMGRIQSCMILFCSEGIIICGDFCPRGNGVVSNYGYGLGWFSTPKGEDYLCEKFLSEEFSSKVAHDAVVQRVEELKEALAECGEDSKYGAQYKMALEVYGNALEEDDGESIDCEYFGTPERFADLINEADDCDSMEYNADDYNERDAEVLCAIQQRFVEEYARLIAEEKAS